MAPTGTKTLRREHSWGEIGAKSLFCLQMSKSKQRETGGKECMRFVNEDKQGVIKTVIFILRTKSMEMGTGVALWPVLE